MALELIHISLSEQTLRGFSAGRESCLFPVSTALNGAGEMDGSGCTPRGQHRVRARIGDGEPLGAVFVGRRPTGEVWSPELAACHPQRDWILTRILWLCGEQPGFNRGGDCDSQRRFIYLHGTPDDQPMGVALSHGCIRLRNTDMLELFAQTPVGCRVLISEQSGDSL
ncbi:L,D-transpeptidase [Halopseudomonas salegens]|uniref:L,D-transpeptidase catalytic domain n=1 Tax=Halopseudomonas salegens TaxID=1434072 RepID=A0A1H2EWU2_9GAMM|nr:L,D-transpeptidase [Halopseudomonas salegens]SDT99577.1 L,D-transpeptidase catalytic domain [Halopseudomonas salegens]